MFIKTKKVEESNYINYFYQDDTPIHIACEKGHLPIVKYLIEKQKVHIDIKRYVEYTPLHYACQFGHLRIVEYLI